MKSFLKNFQDPILIAPVAMIVSPGVNSMLRIGYPFASYSAVIFIALLCVAGIGLALLCRRYPRLQRSILTVLLVWLVWQGEWEGIIAQCTTLSETYSLDRRVVFSGAMIAGVLVVYGIVALLRRHAMVVAAAFSSVTLISTLAFVEFDGAALAPRPDAEVVLDKSLPPFVFVILDEQTGIGGLPPGHPDSPTVAARLRETYRDFVVHEDAYSRYMDTRISLPAIMSGVTGNDHPDAMPSASGWRIGGNALYRHLDDLGYAIRSYSSGYPDLCEDEVAVCFRLSNWHMGLIERSGLSLAVKLEQLLRRLGVSLGVRFVPHYGPLASLEIVDHLADDLRIDPRGQAFIVHLLLPHHPYVLDSDCQIVVRTMRDPLNFVSQRAGYLTPRQRRDAYHDYLDQVLCADAQVGRLLDALRESGTYDDATVVVTGDHGARLSLSPFTEAATDMVSDEDAVDVFSALIAVKKPGTIVPTGDRAMSIQDVIAEQVLGFSPSVPPSQSVYLVISPEDQAPPEFRAIPLPRHFLEPASRTSAADTP